MAGYEGLKQRESAIDKVVNPPIRTALQRLADFYQRTGQTEPAAASKQELAKFEQAVRNSDPAPSPAQSQAESRSR